jgi:hypothetical protein
MEVNLMSSKELIAQEIKKLPEVYLGEILDFIRFLENKTLGEKRQIAIASQSSLKKDWLSPEEDEAWKNL